MTTATILPVTATGPDILKDAAVLLSAVVGPGPLMGSDLHTALTLAAGRCRAGGDQAEANRLADEAAELFNAWLVKIGEVDRSQPVTRALRGWMHGRRLGTVGYALRAAGEHWRAELVTELTAPGGECR